MPTLMTDPRSGGVKKKSGVNVLPIIHETWSKVRSDDNETTFLLATYAPNSKQDIDLLRCGTDPNPLTAIFSDLDLPQNIPIFGGMRIIENGKVSFASFVYIGEEVGVMAKGRASMHTNGVLNVLEGCSGDWNNVEVWRGMTVEMLGKSKEDCDLNTGESVNLGKDITGGDGAVDVDVAIDDNMPEDEWNTNAAKVDDTSRVGKDRNEHGHYQMSRGDRFHNDNDNHNGSRTSRKDNTINVPTSTSSAEKEGNEDTIVADVDGRDDNDNDSNVNTTDNNDDGEFIPYEQLKNLSLAEFPKVDPSKKEMSLSHVEFQDIFHMTKEDFYQLPKWKQTNLKKGVSLF